ncbi:hypothetical protein [Planosporangium mesophilum]|uniref:Uncharacterized protein n=1 Tax=Planosporangium mesophilum TaxID=689768 RepID=A0A8J3TA68_9ACTN|nr:hypothetical protein [Planosporangium mesophilum]NJC82664.1 hypothetical protein [Planosporangium mesophilum]GII21811.1 hypothetical protein Pme01_14080 [Planosporangium mesophilum]
MVDEIESLRRARAAARSYAAVTQDMVEFLDRTSAVPSPEQEAEYAALLGREELQLKERQEALHALGLVVRSLEAKE